MSEKHIFAELRTRLSDFAVRRIVDVMGDNLIYAGRNRQAPLFAPEEYGLQGFEERSVTSADGTRIGLWYKPPEPGKPTYVAFHGRGGHWGFAHPYPVEKNYPEGHKDFGYRHQWLDAMAQTGAGVVAVHTRGFGLSANPSTKSMSEAAIRQDMQAVDGFLQQQAIAPERTIVTGESLGGALAAVMSETMTQNGHPAGMLGLVNTFSDMTRAIHDTMVNMKLGPLRPLQWASEENLRKKMDNPLHTGDRLGESPRDTRLYVAHAPDDEVVAQSHSRRLLANTHGRDLNVTFRALVGTFRRPLTRSHTSWDPKALVADMQATLEKDVLGRDGAAQAR